MKNFVIMAQLAAECAQQRRTDEALLHMNQLVLSLLDASRRLENLATSMEDRAKDNPLGVKAETLAMFAGELRLAIQP